MGEPEDFALRRSPCCEVQKFGAAVEPPEDALGEQPLRTAGGNAVDIAQIAPQIVPQRAAGEIALGEHRLRLVVQRAKMVLAGLHPVPHFIIGKARGGGVEEELALLGLRGIGAVEDHEGIREGRRGADEGVELRIRAGDGAK